MRKITDFIVKHCYAVLAVFLGLAAVSGFFATQVKINHDISEYMPATSETRLGKNIMDEEFSGEETSSWMMMFDDLSDTEKSEVQSYLESVGGVTEVAYDSTEDYNKDNHTLYIITVEGAADGEIAKNAYADIHNHFDGNYKIAEKGDVSSNNGNVLSMWIILGAVGCAMLILTIMSASYIEPWLYLASIMLGVAVNYGTNIIFPSVSHITSAIAAILQMALSMDYAIMLSNRYRQERQSEPNKRKAMQRALASSFTSISASSITTIVGLFVLVFMSFTIGRDMGLVMSKGVLFSLISIFTTLPTFLLMFDKLIQKTAKKSFNPKLNAMGKAAYSSRFFAVPVFLVIMVASFFLKGNVGILYTDTEMDKIKDVFTENNQMAVIYDNSMEDQASKVCHDYESNSAVTRVLCYGNTINEPETVAQLKPKFTELGTDIDVADYLLKVVYYHYYNPDESHTMTVTDFVNFIQSDIFNNENFSAQVTPEVQAQINRLANFTNSSLIHQPRTIAEIASLLEVDPSQVANLLVLYNAQFGTSTRLTLHQFATFVNYEVLTDPQYASEIPASARTQLAQLDTYSNPTFINQPMTAAQLAQQFGLTTEQVQQLFLYNISLSYQAPSEDEVKAQIMAGLEAAGLLKTDEELALMTPEQIQQYQLSLQTIVAQKAEEAKAKVMSELQAQAAATTMSPADFVNFLLAHANDEALSGQISASAVQQLQLAAYIMNNTNAGTTYSAYDLASQFGLDSTSLNLLYSLYNYKHVNCNPTISLYNLIGFMLNTVAPSPKYGNQLDSTQVSKLSNINYVMNTALAGTQLDEKQMYSLLTSLSQQLESRLVDVLYIYNGSLSVFNDDWTLTIEQFVNYLNDNILTDNRFSNLIKDSMRVKITDAKVTIADAKDLLVGPKHSRVILNTTLPAEGDETFSFIQAVKDNFGQGANGATFYVIGNSPMAYEMSQTFNREMDFITILTMLSIFVVVAISFKSLVIPFILVLLIQTAVWITMSILSFTGSSIYFIALIIVQSILMGATIDYAILYTSYYLEHRQTMSIKQAIINSYNKSIHTILTSASILIVVTAIVGNFASAIAAKICTTISQGTLCSAILILLFLPAILAACDKIVVKKQRKA